MSKKNKPKSEIHEYQAEMQKLLEILVHSLYTEREIFVRELVSNASDALSKVQLITLTEKKVLEKETELQIIISSDEKNRKIVIEDSGCGMTKEELLQNLGTIANSGTLKFLEQTKSENKPAENLIGQFGVGFYSVFMVADRVELISRSWHNDSQAGCVYTISAACWRAAWRRHGANPRISRVAFGRVFLRCRSAC